MTPLHRYLLEYQVFQSSIFFRTKHNTLLLLMWNNHSGIALYYCIGYLIYDSTVFGVEKLQEKRLEFEKKSINVFPDTMINEETTALSATLTRAFTYLRLIVR